MKEHNLLESSKALEDSVIVFKNINQRAHSISLSAAIEGARMKNKISTFSIVADQITQQTLINNELNIKLEELVQEIKSLSAEAISVRNYELASDLMDKLDRNLFERNCDVQAWATFETVKNALLNPDGDSIDLASAQLAKLVDFYVVYLDSFLIGHNGKVVACAKNINLIGHDYSEETWFKSAVSGQISVSESFYDESIQKQTVRYCSPIKNEQAEIIGVLSNCFNWDFALEMIESVNYGENYQALIIDSKTHVIASKIKNQILNDSLIWLNAGLKASNSYSGFGQEHARNGEAIAVGFKHTQGYNSYPGKNWSSIVIGTIPSSNLEAKCEIITNSKQDKNELQTKKNEIESEKSITKLNAMMAKVDKLVLEINTNNRKVKFLAVNASIQAGLAGEEGEGFSIIANEVAMLAKSSLAFVKDINTITANLREAVQKTSLIRLVDSAYDTISKIDRNLFERYCDIQAWSIFSTFIHMLESDEKKILDTTNLLKSIHQIYEVYHDISLLNTEGDVLATAINQNLLSENFANTDWFKNALSGQIFVSDIEFSKLIKHPIIVFAAPVLNKNSEIVGVISSFFNCKFINDILKAAVVDSASDIFLLNKEGFVIASRKEEDIFEINFAHLDVVQNPTPQESGLSIETTSANSNKFLIGYGKSTGYNTYDKKNWTVITHKADSNLDTKNTISPAEAFRLTREHKKKEGEQ